MAIVLTVLFWVAALALLLILLAGALPLRIELGVRKNEAWRCSAVLRPFAGFGPKIRLSERKPSHTTRKTAKKPRKRGQLLRANPMRVVLATQQLLGELLHRVRFDRADIDMTLGLGDPADTGQAFGMLAPLVYGAHATPRMNIRLQPVFEKAALRGRADMRLSLIPILLVMPFVRFGWALFGAKT